MHDQKKTKERPDEVARRQEQERIAKFKVLYADCFQLRADKTVTEAALQKLEELLDQNPDCYSLFAFRRRVLEGLWKQNGPKIAAKEWEAEIPPSEGASREGGADEATTAKPPVLSDEEKAMKAAKATAVLKEQMLVKELKFNTNIVKRDYKSYFAWEHRRWIIRGLSKETQKKVFVAENAELEKLLKVDERNFHAWGYRRWVTTNLANFGLHDEAKELAFTEAKIGQNFSNYSAWHNRAMIFRRRVNDAPSNADSDALTADQKAELTTLLADIDKELSTVIRAVYTDSIDQSAWFFAKFFLVEICHRASKGDGASKVWQGVATKMCNELLENAEVLVEEVKSEEADDGNAASKQRQALKWPLYIQFFIKTQCTKFLDEGVAATASDDVKALAAELTTVDPMRRAVYAPHM